MPNYIKMDQDSAFIIFSHEDLFKKLNIKIRRVVPNNHQLLQAEHGIKSLSIIPTKTFGKSRSEEAKIFTSGYIGIQYF